MSEMPPTFETTTGRPIAMASMEAIEKQSPRVGKTNKLAFLYRSSNAGLPADRPL